MKENNTINETSKYAMILFAKFYKYFYELLINNNKIVKHFNLLKWQKHFRISILFYYFITMSLA